MNDNINKNTKILFKQIKENLQKSLYAKDFLESIGWSLKEISYAPIGYIPSINLFNKILEEKGADMDLFKAWGILDTAMEYCIVVGWGQPDGSIKINGFSFGPKNKNNKKSIFQNNFKKDKPFLFSQAKHKKENQIIIVNSAFDSARLQANGYASISIGGNSISREQVKYLVQDNQEYLYIIEDSSKARLSAEKLILDLSKFNISIKITQSKNKNKCEYSIFSGMSSEEIKELLKDQNSASDGSYMASRINSQYKSGSNKSKIDLKIKKWDREMSKSSSEDYKLELKNNDIEVETDTAEILRAFANLLDLNFSQDEAKAIIKKRFNIYINIQDLN